jgi:hypothetical protein
MVDYHKCHILFFLITICLCSGSVVLMAVLSNLNTEAIDFPLSSSEQNNHFYHLENEEGLYTLSLARLAVISTLLLQDCSASTFKYSAFTTLQLPPPKVI